MRQEAGMAIRMQHCYQKPSWVGLIWEDNTEHVLNRGPSMTSPFSVELLIFCTFFQDLIKVDI
jgi:hypothetical protein